MRTWMGRSVFWLALLASAGSAQQPLWQVTGSSTFSVGLYVAFIGDVDGDGYDDLASGADNRVPVSTPQVMIYSGRDGSTLRIDYPLGGPGYSFYCLVDAGDMDGDGVRDYAVSTTQLTCYPPCGPPLEIVEVRSAATGDVIWHRARPIAPVETQFGYYLAGDLDLDGDGKPDLLVAAPRENNNQGAVHAYDNAGNLLYKVIGFPWSLGRLGGDLDGDGADDFLIGGQSPSLTGAAMVYSGRTGTFLRAGYGEFPGDGLGTGDVLGCGDVDGDGVVDFVGSSDGTFGPGLVRVFSGATANAIYTWRNPLGGAYGRAVAAGDLDLDGVQDLLIQWVFCPNRLDAALEWRSLRTGQVIKAFCAPIPPVGTNTFGALFAIGPPQPDHPFPLIAVDDPSFGAPNAVTALQLFRATPAGVESLGLGCTGTLAAAPQLGFTDLGASGIRVHISNAPASATALLAFGLSSTSWLGNPLPLSLAPFGFGGCSLQTSVELALPVTTGIAGINAGYASFDIPVPLGSYQLMLDAQWLVLGTGERAPGALSAGLTWAQ